MSVIAHLALANSAGAAPSRSIIKLPVQSSNAAASLESSVLKEKPPRNKKAKLTLQMESGQYVSAGQTYFRDGASANDATVGFRLEDRSHLFYSVNSVVDIKNDYSAQENWNYFKPKEAYLTWNQGAGKGAFGRKLETWSAWEDFWGQALYQPRYTINRMHPELVGLTGSFNEFKLGQWNATLAVLPIYVPEFGPHHSIQNNRPTSKNAWFHSPPANTYFNNAVGDVHYSVKADAAKILWHPGAAFRAERDFKQWKARASAAYKPMPQLLLGFPSFNQLVVAPGDDYMRVQVSPRVIYQKIASVDAQTKAGGWTLTGSSIVESLDKDNAKEDWTNQKIKDAFIIGVVASRPLRLDGPRAPRITLGATKIWGGDAADSGYFADKKTLFERRYQYLEAYSIGLSKDLILATIPVETSGQVIFDPQQNGGIVSLSSSATLQPNLKGMLTLDFIGLVNQHGKVKDGYLSTFRANDRVGVGVSYVY